jgi:cytochrome c553
MGLSGSALAGDAVAGKSKAASCAGCHGATGVSNNPMWPNLAGQQAGYLAKQLRAFRDGSRSDPMMGPMAKPLSDADIDNLAAYYSSL